MTLRLENTSIHKVTKIVMLNKNGIYTILPHHISSIITGKLIAYYIDNEKKTIGYQGVLTISKNYVEFIGNKT